MTPIFIKKETARIVIKCRLLGSRGLKLKVEEVLSLIDNGEEWIQR